MQMMVTPSCEAPSASSYTIVSQIRVISIAIYLRMLLLGGPPLLRIKHI